MKTDRPDATGVTPSRSALGRSTLIIGGGVIGLTLAWERLRRGDRVTLVERDRVGRGTSWAATGILPPARFDTATDPLDRLRGLSHDLFPDWSQRLEADTGIDVGFRRCGGWYLAETPGEHAAMTGMTDYWGELGIACDRVAPDQLREREPGLAGWAESNPRASAWWAPGEYQIRSPDFLRALQSAVRQHGGELIEGGLVNDVRDLDDGGEALVGDRWRRADSVVICGGAWTGLIAERFGLGRSVVPVRGQILLLRFPRPTLRGIVNVGNRYIVCRDDGRTLVGSVEEEVGFRPGTTPDVLDQLHAFAVRVCDEFKDADVESCWSGFRPMTFDGFPMIGRVPSTRNLFVASGHFRSGVHLSCGTAVALADAMDGVPPPIDLSPFGVGKQQQRIPSR